MSQYMRFWYLLYAVVKPVLRGHLKEGPKNVFKTDNIYLACLNLLFQSMHLMNF